MNIYILSCGVFEPELTKVLDEIKKENIFKENINVKYLPFGLHANLNKLKSEIIDNLESLKSHKVILLYGSTCHYDFHRFLDDYDNVITFNDSNCMELIVNNHTNENNLYLTPGWVMKFDELNKFINAVDIYDIRQQYGQYENVIIGDTNVFDITDEMIFDLFEKIQVPIETENIDINIFKNKIIESINKARRVIKRWS